MRSQRLWLRALVPSLLLLAGVLVACDNDKDAATPADPPPSTAQNAQTRNGAAVDPGNQQASNAPSTNATELVSTVRESVVRVRAGGTQQRGPFGGPAPAEGAGTGFVIDDRGFIVTNNHVVTLGAGQPAPRLEVDLWDGRTMEATLVGRDSSTDLAVLRIEADGIKSLRFAAPDTIAVGQDVFAIGFALDLGTSPTVTRGVVSATDRVINETVQGPGGGYRIDISGAIQTDAAINPGNSGGPLINLRGEVVGVNTAGLVSVGGQPVQSIFFAVGAQVAEPIVRTLIEEGNIERGFLGISAAGITREIARANNLGVDAGVGVIRVEPGSAADRAGLRRGDVITGIGEVDINNSGDVTRALFRYQPGTTVPVEFVRNGQRRTVDVTLGTRPNNAG
jgi:serine protease Do